MALASFRELVEDLGGDHPGGLFAEVLEPRLEAARRFLEPLRYVRRLRDAPPGRVAGQDLCALYALNVLNDQLLLPLQISRGEYRRFFEALDFEVFEPDGAFDPVLCEVVGVANWRSLRVEEGITLGCCYWPGLRYGEMIFSRCAVDVYCHPAHGLLKGVADRSHLHFTRRRMQREASDLSAGWGQNSSWRTALSRNYRVGDYSFLNVDAAIDLGSDAPGGFVRAAGPEGDPDLVPLAEAREVLLHRCFVRTTPPGRGGGGIFPYRWRMALHGPGPLWPLAASSVVPFDQALAAIGIPPATPATA